MKKKILIMLLVLWWGIGFATVGFATEEENVLKKVGEEEARKGELILIQKKKEIENYLHEIAHDGKVTPYEMVKLIFKVNKFEREKEKIEKGLKIFNVKLQTGIDEVKRIVEVYKQQWYQDDEKETIRKFFITKSGRNVEIGSGYYIAWIVTALLLIACVVWCIIFSYKYKLQIRT